MNLTGTGNDAGLVTNAISKVEITDKEEHIIALDVSDKSGNGWYIYAGINTAGGAWSSARTADVTEVHLDELV